SQLKRVNEAIETLTGFMATAQDVCRHPPEGRLRQHNGRGGLSGGNASLRRNAFCSANGFSRLSYAEPSQKWSTGHESAKRAWREHHAGNVVKCRAFLREGVTV